MRDLPILPAQSILALRHAILCRRAGRDTLPELERRLGSRIAARRFRVLMEAMGQIWPDPFAVAPPCCSRLSFDEALLAQMVMAAALQDRHHFDFLSAEMLGMDARDMLYACLHNFLSAQGLAYH
ncbi:MAG TPA: addiction module antidote protein [Sphingopyxis sp.]|nr:addiction module antidote protein [Sphingopyxis sp.]